ncbi:hypothetical protein M9434_004455 [Picochlorum sp. BPE23]|nr:hypothetical protein M9434_004455 [Picochlorum sp. BPE23]
MVKLVSIEEVYSSKSGSLKTSAMLKISPNVKSKITLADTTKPSLVNVDLSAKNWSLSHDTKSKDTTFRANWKPSSDVKVNMTQKIPGNKAYLVPNPHIKVTKTGVFGKGSNSVAVEHDMMQRRSGATLSLYAGEDKRYKLKLSSSTSKGGFMQASTGMLRSKLAKGTLLHSASISGSTKAQVMTLKSRLGSDMKTKMSYSTSNQSLSMVGIQMSNVDGHKVRTTLTVSAPVHQMNKPQVQVGVKLDL